LILQHPHQLKLTAVKVKKNGLTENKRRELRKQKQIQLNTITFFHANTCTSADCPSVSCIRMKALLRHPAQCKVSKMDYCPGCQAFWFYVTLHVKLCKANACPIPNCTVIKERYKQRVQKEAVAIRERKQIRNLAVSE
jgi:hypothetical protein